MRGSRRRSFPRRLIDLVGGAARRRRRTVRLAGAGIAALLLVSAPRLWTTVSARDHVSGEAAAPSADVVMVLGTAVAADRRKPGLRLAGRLQTAAALIHSGRARVILVSGDAGGASGDETAAMTTYLVENLGVDPRRVVVDPSSLDTYDSCVRARQVYGVRRALVVTQAYHLSRAVTLCRHLGIDADGVTAGCDGCSTVSLAGEAVRDYFASGKAVWDTVRHRPPAISSPTNRQIQDALRELR